MKRRKLIKEITKQAKQIGEELTLKEGGAHTIVRLGDRRSVIPRHAEINEITAKQIKKQLGLK